MVLQYGTLTSRRPHLEYGATVWNPHFKKQITLIENVQRRATKQIPGLAYLSYLERLQLLKLPTLQYRRYRGDMIEMYKLSHGHYDEAATPERKLQKRSPKILVQVSRHGPMEQPSRCLSRSIKFERLQEPFRQIVGTQRNYV